jgi:hypothetical protein
MFTREGIIMASILQKQKTKMRGFVMTGGGAKGLYEAGVIHALHISGMEFDVITGSSIGAINSVFFAEYLYHKHRLPDDVRQDPLRAIEQMDPLVRAYHHAWLQLPDKRLIDDREEGPLGKIKNDLLRFNLNLPQIVRLGWWWTDPQHGKLPPPDVWPALIGLGKELLERLGGCQELLRIIKDDRSAPVREAARTYLARFRMDRSLVPPEEDHRLRDVFTQQVSPLRAEHLQGEVSAPDPAGNERYVLVDPERTLRDYSQQDIAVRLTRANYRTGRLEMSAWIRVEDFVRFMQKQAWKLKAFGPEKLPLGNFRLQVPGNPNAINAALCSGRFPGVFTPYPIGDLYPASDPENLFLSRLLSNWLEDPEIETRLQQAYQTINPQASAEKWAQDYGVWRDRTRVGDYFPQTADTYVDGGAIDNTPTSSAVDFVREQIEQKGLSRREVILDLFVIFLDTEPKVGQEKANNPAIFEVVMRTLALQGAAKKSSDANTVGTINAFGQHGEELGRVLQALLESYRETLKGLDPGKAREAQEALRERVHSLLIHDLSGKVDKAALEDVLDQIDRWCEKMIAGGLPLHVNVIKIYPQAMPLDTLQFTERLGYRKENAIRLLTMGCYDTLAALRRHLEGQAQKNLDAEDRQVLTLVQKWMGDSVWPDQDMEQERYLQEWHCQRKECVFHSRFCSRGGHPPVG